MSTNDPPEYLQVQGPDDDGIATIREAAPLVEQIIRHVGAYAASAADIDGFVLHGFEQRDELERAIAQADSLLPDDVSLEELEVTSRCHVARRAYMLGLAVGLRLAGVR